MQFSQIALLVLASANTMVAAHPATAGTKAVRQPSKRCFGCYFFNDNDASTDAEGASKPGTDAVAERDIVVERTVDAEERAVEVEVPSS